MTQKITIDEHKLWAILHQTSDSLNRCKQNAAQKSPITNQQLTVLWNIKFISESTNKPVIITELIPYLNRSPASISSMIFRLEEKGLLKTSRDLPDRRLINIQMTAKGLKVFSKAVQPRRDLIKKLFQKFSKKEIKTLTSLLSKLKYRADEVSNIPSNKKNLALNDDHKIIQFLNDEGDR